MKILSVFLVAISLTFTVNASEEKENSIRGWYICEVIVNEVIEDIHLPGENGDVRVARVEVAKMLSWSDDFNLDEFKSKTLGGKFLACLYIKNEKFPARETAGIEHVVAGDACIMVVSVDLPDSWRIEGEDNDIAVAPFSVPVLLVAPSEAK